MTRIVYSICVLSAVVMSSIISDDTLNQDHLSIHTTSTGDCTAGTAKDDQFVTIHFKGYFEDGTPISST